MDAARFDALTRTFSPGRSRRGALGLLAGAALALGRARGAGADHCPSCGGGECPPENPYWCESLDKCVCRQECCPLCGTCGGECTEEDCRADRPAPKKKKRRKKRKKRR